MTGAGDEILAAGQAQRLWNEHHIRVLICDQHGTPRWHPMWDGSPIIMRPEEATDPHQRLISGPNCRPYIVYPFTPETGWTFNKDFRCRDHIAHLYLTNEERFLGLDCLKRYGPYLLIEPWSKHPNLRWPMPHWNDLCARISEALPQYTIVQHTHKDSVNFVADHAVVHRPTTFRETCGLIAHAACYIRGESGLLHAAAALGIPSVAIWGSCMDWEVMGGYPKEVGVGIVRPFCGFFKACPHCEAAMQGILPEQVLAGLLQALSPTSCVTSAEVGVE